MKYYWIILRPLNIIITAISALVAYLLATSLGTTPINLINMVLVSGVTALSAGAGNLINDIFDLEIDRLNKPNRPLPSGKISTQNATRYYYSLITLILLIATPLGLHSFLAVAIVNAALYLYAATWKKKLFIKNLVVAAICGYLFYFSSITTGNYLKIVPLAIAAFFFHLIREIIKDMADQHGDKSVNNQTLVLAYGVKRVNTLLRSLIFSLSLFLLYASHNFGYSYLFDLFIYLTILPLLIYIFFRVGKTNSTKEYEFFSKLMKFDMLFGLASFYFGMVF